MTPPFPIRVARVVIPRLPLGRYRVARALKGLRLAPFRVHMPASVGGFSFECDLRDVIARDVCLTGMYEPQETMLALAVLRPGMTFVDVGANWGYYTLIAAAAVGPSGLVVALEPDPRLFSRLERNIVENRLCWVRLLRAAAAAWRTPVTLLGYEENSGNFGLSRVVTSVTGATFSVEAAPLDDMLHDLHVAGVDLMKMDIEGGEAEAIHGLRGMIARRQVSRLLIELHPQQLREQGLAISDVHRPLLEAGYRGVSIDHSSRTTRLAAYGRVRDVRSLLRPLSTDDRDEWPHQLWLAPGVTPP